MVSSKAASSFLLPTGLSVSMLQSIAVAALDLEGVDQDSVRFEEGGGDVDLDLAVPFLAGMDDVTVDAARLTLHGVDTDVAVDGWHTVSGAGGNGVFVVLEHPARLRRLVIAEPPAVPGQFLVIRAATLAAAPVPGAPLAADRGFSVGDMLPPPLARLSVSGEGSGRLTVTLPATAGQAWLVQYATGDSVPELKPVAVAPQVFSVTVRPAPEDVSLALRAGDGAAEQQLWQHPGAVLAEAGDQLADFTPAAAARLGSALAALNAAGGEVATLGLPLRFRSARGGTLGIRDRRLDVSYRARPLGPDPAPLALDGGWQDLALDAPTRRPTASELRLAGRHRGLAVNPGSGVPPATAPLGGVRVRPGRVVAAPAAWVTPPGGPSPLARIRLYAVPFGDTEVVCEVRRDAAGAPGALIAPPAVTRVDRLAPPGWVTVRLATPVPLAPGPLWITARTNRGQLDWFATATPGEPAGARVSSDGGSTWAGPEGSLAPTGPPVTQLLDQVDPATRPAPTVQLRIGPAPAGPLALVPGAAVGEYAQAEPTLPTAVLDALEGATTSGPGPRRRTTLSLWSADLLDLRIQALACSYDPFAGR
jgi:hypothetical protein